MVIPCAGWSAEICKLFALVRVYQILNARFIFENLLTYCAITVLIALNTTLKLHKNKTANLLLYKEKYLIK